MVDKVANDGLAIAIAPLALPMYAFLTHYGGVITLRRACTARGQVIALGLL